MIIAILGASGGVGSCASRWLAQSGHALRLGGRRSTALQPLGLELNAEIQTVDLWQDRQLSAFCRGWHLFLPSVRWSWRGNGLPSLSG